MIYPGKIAIKSHVALLAEGVGRNVVDVMLAAHDHVALLAEGVGRNPPTVM